MKRSIVLPAILLLAGMAFLAMGQSASAAGLKCAGAGGKSACTAAQIASLNAGIASGKRMHKPFVMDIDSVSAGANGTLVCRKAGGGMCTEQQIDALVEQSKTISSEIIITKTRDMSSPSLMQ